jgi:hypothetical protein
MDGMMLVDDKLSDAKTEQYVTDELFDYVCEHKSFQLPITKVDGIVCCVMLRHRMTTLLASGGEKSRIELHVTARYKDRFMYGSVFHYTRECEDEIMLAKKKFYKQIMYLNELIYSPNINVFRIPDDKISPEENTFNSKVNGTICGNETIASILTGSKISLSIDECSVCLNKTRSTLPCNHYLCLVCETKLKKTKCPICRGKYHRFSCDCGECEDCEDDGSQSE